MSGLKIRSDKINVYRQLVLPAHFTSRIGRERLRIFFFLTYLEMQLRDICNHYAKSLDSQNGYYLTWNLIGGNRLEIEKKMKKICPQSLTLSIQLRSRLFHVVDWTRIAATCTKRKKVGLFFIREL